MATDRPTTQPLLASPILYPQLCPACQYDLRAHPTVTTCPECGTPTRSGPISINGSDPLEQLSFLQHPIEFLNYLALILICLAFYHLIQIFAALAGVIAAMFIYKLGKSRQEVPSNSTNLFLDHRGFELVNHQSNFHLQDAWLPGDNLSISRAFLSSTRDVNVVRRGKKVLSIRVHNLQTQPESIINQVRDWVSLAKPTTAQLLPFRRCPHCGRLVPFPHCPVCRKPIPIPLYIFPLVPRHRAIDLLGRFLVMSCLFILTLGICALSSESLSQSMWPLLFVSQLASHFSAMYFRPFRYSNDCIVRLSRGGYQICHPDDPINLTPTNHRYIYFHPTNIPSTFHFQFGRRPPIIWGLPGNRKIILTPDLPDLLESELAPSTGFPIRLYLSHRANCQVIVSRSPTQISC